MDKMSPVAFREYLWQRVQSKQWKDDNLPRLPPQLVQLPDGVYKVTLEGGMMKIEPMKEGGRSSARGGRRRRGPHRCLRSSSAQSA
jgi:hypothetical protein